MFDIVTLGRIDDLFNILQQTFYLLLISWLLSLEILAIDAQTAPTQRRLPRLIEKYWQYHPVVTHFFFGSLLSVYTLFYFKSASLIQSFLFFTVMTVLLVLNEFERFQKMGAVVKFGLLSLCVTSYFLFIVPLVLGWVGLIPFVVALALNIGVFYGLYRLIGRKVERGGEQDKRLKQKILAPGFAIPGLFLVLYLFHLIPPVPLSMEYIGVYHQIERQGEKFVGRHQNPWWLFWRDADEVFAARPGDKVFCMARIFSPVRFRDQVYVRWLYKDPRYGWQNADRIPVEVKGGRAEGYRGVTYKSNFTPGKWRVKIESSDGREIGRRTFEIVDDVTVGDRLFFERSL